MTMPKTIYVNVGGPTPLPTAADFVGMKITRELRAAIADAIGRRIAAGDPDDGALVRLLAEADRELALLR